MNPTNEERMPHLTFLVDDEHAVLMALARSLAQQGFKSKGFSTTAEALKVIERHRPDCVIADYYMPDGNGVEFLEELRRRDPTIARVVLTGGHVDERLKNALEDETVQILVLKPWSLHTIHAMMEHVHKGDTHIFLGSVEDDPLDEEFDNSSALGIPNVRVLVVDDDVEFLTLVENSLAKMGYHCLCIPDANEILERLESSDFNVVLLDLVLPGRSGLEAIGLIREKYPSLPIIAMTASNDREMAVNAFRLGSTALLQKPFGLPVLEDTLRRSAQLGRLFSDYLSRPELNAMIELQHAIGSDCSIPELLDLLLQQMIRFTGADSASVLLVEPDGRSMRIAASYGLGEIDMDKKITIGERVSGWVAEHNQPQMVIGGGDDDPRLAGLSRNRPPLVGLCLPMRGRDSLVGVLCLSRFEGRELFSRDAIDLGLLLSSEVARAIERAGAAEQQMDIERSVMRRDKLVTIGELASGVAHEINNPLGYVSSNLNSLEEYFKEVLPILNSLADDDAIDVEAVKKRAKEIDLGFILKDIPGCITETVSGIRRVLHIVNDLKNFTRDDMESREAADINQVLDGAVNILWNQIKQKAELIKDYTEDLPEIQCYPSQLGQVILNLLYNAVQAIEREGSICLSSKQENGQIVVEVRDNGCGMEPDVLLHIFEPFYTTKPRGVGTGLGLSIARKIVERHGGRLSATSDPGNGSTFRVVLPLETNQTQVASQ